MYENPNFSLNKKTKKLETELLTTILTVVQDGICIISPELDIFYQNPAMQFWYETQNSTTPMKCYSLYHGRTSPCKNCPALRAMKSGQTEKEEVLFIKKGKRSGWQEVFCTPMFGEDGKIELLIEYVRDITDARKATLAAELIEAQNRELTNLLNQREKEQYRLEQKRMESINQSFSSILRYLRSVLDSNSFDLIRRQLELTKSNMGSSPPEGKLSGQELTIARYIADGYMSKEIAERMHLSKKAIDYHRSNIRKKLELTQSEDLRQAILVYFAKSGISRLE